MYFFLAVLGLCCCTGFSPAATSRGYSLVAVHGLLTAAASLIAEHGLQGTGSMAAALELSCSAAREILPDQGSNLCLLHWQADSLRVSHQGGPIPLF